MARLILANQSSAAKRRVYFHLVDATDGITPETGEAGGQPQISTNGGAWTSTGIGTLTSIGNGRYFAEVTQATVATAGDIIESRFKSANTAECPGDSLQVVAFDLDDAIDLGLTNLDSAVSSRLAASAAPTNFGAMSITAGGLVDQTQASADKVWSSAARTLTSLGASLVQEIWDRATSALTTAGSIGKLIVDNLNAAISSIPTAVQVADALLGRNVAGGSSGGRTVTSALRFLRNRKQIAAGTLTVYQENDTTADWTAAVTTTAGNPVSEVDPA